MAQAFFNGMDVSFLDEIEREGGTFSDGGQPGDCLAIMRDNGVNSIRLRIWNDPDHGYCNLERTLLLAKRIKALGLHFLLDFHYSDGWADPGKQWKPKAWEGLDYDGLKQAVYDYTYKVLAALKDEGTLPDMVQIGNEITPGMLWDEGKVDGELDTDAQWTQFADLVKAGIAAANAVDPEINIMIHIDRGGDNAASVKFYDRFEREGVKFDTIGLSYYPWWHGTFEDLKHNLNDLAERYGKDIVVVETAYPWTLEKPDELGLIVEREDQLLAGYPATVNGQARYLQDFIAIIQAVPGGKGVGFHYWEPCWIPCKPDWSVGHANNWGNLTMFDFSGRKLDSYRVLTEK
jgi:arabinogalactan endo-1,4-beta-galactosidase